MILIFFCASFPMKWGILFLLHLFSPFDIGKETGGAMFREIYNSLYDFFTSTFTQLLIFIILLFVFRPSDRGVVYDGIWQMLFAIVILMGIFNAQHTQPVKILAFLSGVPSLVFNWIASIYEIRSMVMLYLAFTAIFILIVLYSIIKNSVVNPVVTPETLRGVIVVYFLIAFAFAYLFYLTELIFPNSFHLLYVDKSVFSHSRYLSEMLYFSFVTLLSIGYGDMTATADLSQTLAILEGIVGKFYVALLVSRLVSIYTLLAHKQEAIRIKARRMARNPNQPPPPAR